METYDPKNVNISFAGKIIDGFGPDTIVKVSRNEDTWSFQPSNSGGGSRSRNPNKSGRIEFTLHLASPSNAALSAIFKADELGGTGVGNAFIKDRSTNGAFCMARNAWIVKPPDWERAKEAGAVTWVLESDEISIDHDGLIDTADA